MFADMVGTEDVRVPVGPLLGYTVAKPPWGPRVQWHPALDVPLGPS